MTRYRLGVNTCFAVKRWPEPDAWAEIVAGQLGLAVVQHSLDLVALDVPLALVGAQAEEVARACESRSIEVHSTFTGLAAYSYNQLLHPDPALRDAAEAGFDRAIEFTARAGGRATGGHIGAYSARSYASPDQRRALHEDLTQRLERLAGTAAGKGLEAVLIENMAAYREPSTMSQVRSLLSPGGGNRAAISLCLDVGHQCVYGTQGSERDPYAWLQAMGKECAVVHLQQTDGQADHHWPFTPAYNAGGLIEPARVLEALDASGAESMLLVLEVIFPFEAPDDEVIRDLAQSVEYWQAALRAHGD
jgi:sugar phosphate isomerase/epimerase